MARPPSLPLPALTLPSSLPLQSDWVCAVPDCGKTEGLWLNLGTGLLGCGRRNWDGTGGNGHALAHYNETGGAYPLCVKLGTVTAAGGDVYSYAPDEDDGVEDVHLARHLAHWGINVMALSKTDKSMAELELELNAVYDFSRISEAGRDLVSVSGPGRVGLENLGNTCYINSCMQLLSALPEVGGVPLAEGPVGGFGDAALSSLFFSTCTGATGIQDDLFAQTAKLMAGLGSATYAVSVPVLAGESANTTGKTGAQDAVEASIEADNAVALAFTGALSADAAVLTHTHAFGGGPPASLPPAPGNSCGYLVPRSYRSLVGRGHPDFATAQQQDIREFMVHLFELYDRAYLSPRAGAVRAALTASRATLPINPKDLFTFSLQSRLVCGQSGAVRYVTERAPMLFLRIPAELATNTETVNAARAEAEALAAASAPHPTGAGPAAKKPRLTGPGGTPLPRLHVPFSSVLSTWASPSFIEDWTSPATGLRGSASTSQRIAASTLPRILAVVLARYEQDADWRTVKQDADVPMPLTLDVSTEGIISTPPAPGEALLPAAPPAGAHPPAPVVASSIEPDGALVSMLVDMGFPAGACSRAAMATANAGAEPAMEWLLVHGEDAGFDAPYSVVPGAGVGGGVPAADPVAVATVVDMGFGPGAAAAALAACGGNIERAMDWLFSRAGSGELEGLEGAAGAAPAAASAGAGVTHPDATRLPPGYGRYTLVGFLSHMGPSPASGHYVAHVRKDRSGRSPADKGADASTLTWHIFNDAKVALSEDPPLEQGFVYLYAREA